MVRAVIESWGKNLAIRFPAEIARAVGLGVGQRVEVAATDDALVIRKLPAVATVEALFAVRSSEDWRAL